MVEIKITKCPPGKALGAGDLHRWHGRGSVAGQRDKDLKAWAKGNVYRNGAAISPKQLRKKRRKAEREAERLRQKAERFRRFKQRSGTGEPPPWE